MLRQKLPGRIQRPGSFCLRHLGERLCHAGLKPCPRTPWAVAKSRKNPRPAKQWVNPSPCKYEEAEGRTYRERKPEQPAAIRRGGWW